MNKQSDKVFWHDYLSAYEERVFRKMELNPVPYIFEFGVLEGSSIRLLNQRFPKARIWGGDIISNPGSWPVFDGVNYEQIDQGDRVAVKTMFTRIGSQYDLIIDDGSHKPEDQVNCLMASIPWVKDKGFYIVEDIHPAAAMAKFVPYSKVSLYQVLLAIEQSIYYKQNLSASIISQLATNSLLSSIDISVLNYRIKNVYLYQRNHLPRKCYHCGGVLYNYATLDCYCGVDLIKKPDSMSFILQM